MKKFEIITLCGSLRFKDLFLRVQRELTLNRKIVFTPCFFDENIETLASINSTKIREMLADMHKHKIDLSDGILVINHGGYIGKSTQEEIKYAIAIGKTVQYLEN